MQLIEMLANDLFGFGLLIGYFVIAGLPMVLLKTSNRLSFEVARKLYHLVITVSIIPIMTLFSSWHVTVLVVLFLMAIIYPILARVENTSFFERIAVERSNGEFKQSLVVVQITIAILIVVFWGLLGDSWKYVVIVAVLAWGFGDAAAALVGKTFGKNHIQHPWLEGKKTYEGTFAMFIVAGLTIFFTLLIFTGQPWYLNVAVALLVAPIGATVELFTRRGMDTLTVPLAVGFSVLLLMLFLSFLSI
ncbi:MAG: hypothetical protein KC615_11280 [Anaerolineae bacterium]|nr:hypothetical protein [Anaerolineae bacterium]MCB9460320.1 hypothetical protein [Anaerolineaceae bacterium]